jgi:hypothetical protein
LFAYANDTSITRVAIDVSLLSKGEDKFAGLLRPEVSGLARQSSSATEAGDLEYDLLVYVATGQKKEVTCGERYYRQGYREPIVLYGVNRVGNDATEFTTV